MGRDTEYMLSRLETRRHAEMIVAYQNMATALREFRQSMSGETDMILRDSITAYERSAPQQVRREVAVMMGNDLAQDARSRLERYHEACFANK